MGTHKELSNFTHEELERLNLAHQELCDLPLGQLIEVAQTELNRFKPKNEKEQALKALFGAILGQLAADLIHDAIKSINWSAIVLQIVDLIRNNFSH